jgi:hypothetical protein
MNWKCLVSGGVFLVLAGLLGAADSVSPSTTTDGSFLFASSGLILVSDSAFGRGLRLFLTPSRMCSRRMF